jgi:hypothetical protein
VPICNKEGRRLEFGQLVFEERTSLENEFTVGSEPPFRDDLSREAEEKPLLEVVTRKRVVKTLQAGKNLACALVICYVCGN